MESHTLHRPSQPGSVLSVFSNHSTWIPRPYLRSSTLLVLTRRWPELSQSTALLRDTGLCRPRMCGISLPHGARGQRVASHGAPRSRANAYARGPSQNWPHVAGSLLATLGAPVVCDAALPVASTSAADGPVSLRSLRSRRGAPHHERCPRPAPPWKPAPSPCGVSPGLALFRRQFGLSSVAVPQTATN